MSFHISNFGAFASGLRRYADQDGYVPEVGDEATDFRYDAEEFDSDSWNEFVERAEMATKAAEKAVQNWRKSQ